MLQSRAGIDEGSSFEDSGHFPPASGLSSVYGKTLTTVHECVVTVRGLAREELVSRTSQVK